METTDRLKRNWKSIAFKTIMIVLLIFVIYKQTQIVLLIKNNMAELDADPLVYGARIYNITSCTCFDLNRAIVFDQNSSKTITYHKAAIKPDEFNPDTMNELLIGDK